MSKYLFIGFIGGAATLVGTILGVIFGRRAGYNKCLKDGNSLTKKAEGK